MYDEVMFGGAMAFLGGMILVPFILAIAIYIFSSIALMKFLAQKTNCKDPILAWVPIVRTYIWATTLYEGKDEINLELINQALPKWMYQWYTLIIFGGTAVLGATPLSPVVGIAGIVCQVLVFSQIYKDSMRLNGVEAGTAELIIAGVVNIVGFIRIYTTLNGTPISRPVTGQEGNATDENIVDGNIAEESDKSVVYENIVDEAENSIDEVEDSETIETEKETQGDE